MNVPRYWANAAADAQPPNARQPFRVSLWRGSHESVEEARRLAESAVRALAARIGASGWPVHPYPYPDRALREEILEEHGAGDARALVTRNGYGAEVLNAVRLFTADLDLPHGSGGGGGLLGRLFGKASPRDAAEESFRERIRAHVAGQPFASFRLYRTAAGLRALRTDTAFDPESDGTRRALEALGSDPTYVRLCRGQGCFRARLTPKPWRIGVKLPPGRFPRPQGSEPRFEEWLREYRARSAGHAACRFLDTIGSGRIAAELAPLVRIHDERSGALGEATLA
jgi:hypothetical protein